MESGARRRSAEKREQILKAAERLFLKTGFAMTSMDAITAAAGVSKQTVYSYFPSKEELFETVLRDLVNRNVRILASEHDPQTIPVASRSDFEEAMQELAMRIVSSLMHPTYLGLVKMIISDIGRSPQLRRLFRQSVPEGVIASIAAMLDRARQAAVAVVPDTEAAARLFIGPLLTYVLMDGLLADGPPQPPTRARLEALVAQYLVSIPPPQPEPGTDL